MSTETAVHPCGWRLLIRVPVIQEKSPGGIIIPDQVKDLERVMTMFGEVMELGPLAFTRGDMGGFKWCCIGDLVLLNKYAGARIMIDGVEHRLINDDEVQAVISDLNRVKRA